MSDQMPAAPAATPKGSPQKPTGLRYFFKTLYKQKTLVFMSIPLVIWLIIFKYVPIWGWTMAFQDYKPHLSFWEQEWVGFQHFEFLFTDKVFYEVMRNTLAMSLIKLVFEFVTAITLAILLNELKNIIFKRVVQTISYLPHFISWVVASSIIMTALSVDEGIVNDVLMWLGIIREPLMWLGVGEYFWWIIGVSEVWKNVGWNTIIYLAAITVIDPSLYEAAEIDGAGKISANLARDPAGHETGDCRSPYHEYRMDAGVRIRSPVFDDERSEYGLRPEPGYFCPALRDQHGKLFLGHGGGDF